MTTNSQDVNTSGVRPTEGFPTRHSSIPILLSAVIFAMAVALSPAPVFAQHGGGGGGGGGGSHGGGGGGGGHVGGGSGGGGSHASAPSGGGGSHPSAASAGGSNNSGGHWWNPFHSGSSANGNGASGANVKAGSNANGDHYAAGNNTWQDPPAAAGHAAGHVNYYVPPTGARPTGPQKNPTNGATASTRAAVAAPPHVFPPRRPGYPYYPYYPFYPYYGFGWGGGLWGGGFYPCDPFWGCYGYGYGYGGGYGYYGGSFGGDYSADLSYSSTNDMAGSQEPNPTLYAAPPSDAGQSSREGTSQQQPYVILYLKDGSSYAVSDYWLSGGKLHYVTSYGGENVIDQSQLDLQRTVNENATRGVDFTLRPEPTGNGATAPSAPAPDGNSPAPQQ
jgi:hypothetical protein